jgi:hypothetical protein
LVGNLTKKTAWTKVKPIRHGRLSGRTIDSNFENEEAWINNLYSLISRLWLGYSESKKTLDVPLFRQFHLLVSVIAKGLLTNLKNGSSSGTHGTQVNPCNGASSWTKWFRSMWYGCSGSPSANISFPDSVIEHEVDMTLTSCVIGTVISNSSATYDSITKADADCNKMNRCKRASISWLETLYPEKKSNVFSATRFD